MRIVKKCKDASVGYVCVFRRSIWKHAKTCHLTPGQTEVKVDFPLPIVACNIIVEFSDFYDNFQVSVFCILCYLFLSCVLVCMSVLCL